LYTGNGERLGLAGHCPAQPAAAGHSQPFRGLLKKCDKSILSRRSTPMNADKTILFNPCLSVFIGVQY
jgi:hypothetical protein